MLYFVWPAGGLQPVSGNPRIDTMAHSALIASRRLELEAFRDDILSAISHHVQDVNAARASIGVYPGIGQLIFDDAFVRMQWLRDYRGRRVHIVHDAPLPKVQAVGAATQSTAAQQWHLGAISPPAALTGKNVSVGVIDTGCDTTLFDLQPPGFAAPMFGEYQAGSPPSMKSPAPVHDFGSHGSTVCAFLAGQVSGVAKGVSLRVAALPVTVLLGTQAMILVALDWLNVVGCDIITTSLFTGTPGQLPTASAGPSSAKPSLDAVEYALSQTRSMMKTFVTAAIGNTGNAGSFQHPGSSVHVMGVGAVNKKWNWFGSAYGAIAPGIHKPNIVAPGYELELPTSLATLDTVGGTSFAAPMVAGAAALAIDGDPALRGDPPALQAKLETLVTGVPGNPPANSTGKGLLDLKAL